MSRGGALKARYGRTRTALASWLWEALARAAAQPGAWTRRRLRIRAADLDTLIGAGLVRKLGGTSDVELYEITDAGRTVLTCEGRL